MSSSSDTGGETPPLASSSSLQVPKETKVRRRFKQQLHGLSETVEEFNVKLKRNVSGRYAADASLY